ncbi:MAG TPA: hypothetical protein VIH59_15355 [Candidatus Tectomicrobia bacterium]|jgi:ElaB/YqjD/DUF883 family membrane-anchored ribosome-binding protein
MAESSQNPHQEPGKPQESTRTTDVREQAREVGTQVYDRARELGAQARDQARDMGMQVKEGTQEVIHQVGETASEYYEQGRKAVGQLEKTLEGYIREKPLQSLLIAAGVGMLAGLLWRK